jgi:hypothetical protein
MFRETQAACEGLEIILSSGPASLYAERSNAVPHKAEMRKGARE